jgi:uncharacterized membrane protein YhhN
MIVPGLVAATVVAVIGLLFSEYRGLRPGVWVAKPLASTGFIAVALAAGALETPYGLTVLVALVLCWVGDVFLIPKGASTLFLVGLVSFLLGHVGFAVAFTLRGSDPLWMAAAAVLALPPALVVLRWLHPHLPEKMRAPVVAYVAVISLMVVTAAGTTAATGRCAIGLGAICFYLSDLHVARHRFVSQSFWNKSWGLPLYYAAQLILASTVASQPG